MKLTTGQNFIRQKKYFAALQFFKTILALKPNKPEIFFYLGRVYSELQDFENSLNYYNKYLDHDKDSINCLINLAILYFNIGNKKNSEQYFKKVIKLNKNYILAYYGLFNLSNDLLTEKDFDYLKFILNNNNSLNLSDKSVINFLLSKKKKKEKNIEKELKFIENYHKQSFNSNFSYNKQSQFYYENIIGNFNDKIKFIKNEKSFNNIKPIFIIGLPRSGSTLIEALLVSSEKKIKTYGESNFFNVAIVDQIKDQIFNKNFDIKNFEYIIDLSLLKKSLQDRYKIDNEAIFLDKSLENVFNIEVILKIFPKAKFIHTSRKLNDSILSIYFSMLPELSWTLSLNTIKDYVHKYNKTISFFRKKFPKKILDISLEKLTSNSEQLSKEIFNFCELKWNKSSLEYYKRTDLFTKTLSSSQIRKKISKENQSKYEQYYFLLK
tara:strand:- start:322 stop:1632 length:1311 start_codon:yes stop_codon:yes gene_type:complete